MDFGIGFLSNTIMLPILDFFYRIVPSYGFAIIALTLVIRFALYPLSAKSIRSMRRMRIAQPEMQRRVKEVQERYKDDPAQQKQAMSEVYKEFGNPLAGCVPILLQMPILIALFTTLRGSPFSAAEYTFNIEIFPQDQLERVQPQAFTSEAKNVYLDKDERYPIVSTLPSGKQLAVGDRTQVAFQTEQGKPLQALAAQEEAQVAMQPQFEVTRGSQRVRVGEDGAIEARQPGEAAIKAKIPGVAKDEGFLFIEALGRVGAVDEDGTVHWDIVGMVLFFGLSLYLNQVLSGQQGSSANPQQQLITKITPILFTGMFLFFPLPAGVLLYIVVANIFQILQTLILMREPLPENLQKLAEQQEQQQAKAQGEDELPFEKRSKKKEKEQASG